MTALLFIHWPWKRVRHGCQLKELIRPNARDREWTPWCQSQYFVHFPVPLKQDTISDTKFSQEVFLEYMWLYGIICIFKFYLLLSCLLGTILYQESTWCQSSHAHTATRKRRGQRWDGGTKDQLLDYTNCSCCEEE